MRSTGREPRVHRRLLIKSRRGGRWSTVGFFFAGQPIALVALAAAAVLMLDRVRPEKVYGAIDWPLLVMFAGLFVVVHAFEVNVVAPGDWSGGTLAGGRRSSGERALSVLLSNLVSNVPAVCCSSR